MSLIIKIKIPGIDFYVPWRVGTFMQNESKVVDRIYNLKDSTFILKRSLDLDSNIPDKKLHAAINYWKSVVNSSKNYVFDPNLHVFTGTPFFYNIKIFCSVLALGSQ